MSEYMLPSDEEKIDILFTSMNKIDGILDYLNSSIWGYTLLCSDIEEQQRLDRLFFNMDGMEEFLTLDRLLMNAKDLALRTIHQNTARIPLALAMGRKRVISFLFSFFANTLNFWRNVI